MLDEASTGRALAGLAAMLALAGCGGELAVLRPGDAAPEFSLESLDGETLSLSAAADRLVLIRFWADWCKSCRTEMPMIDEKYRAYRDRGLLVLALNVKQSREVAARFVRDVELSYPVLLDRDGGTARAYGVVGLPTTFLLDRQGRILEEVIGDMNRESLAELLDSRFVPQPTAPETAVP